jgi:hypothetical protein
MAGAEIFFFATVPNSVVCMHSASFPLDTGKDLSLGMKWPACEVDHSLPSSTIIQTAWSYGSVTEHICTVWYIMN